MVLVQTLVQYLLHRFTAGSNMIVSKVAYIVYCIVALMIMVKPVKAPGQILIDHFTVTDS